MFMKQMSPKTCVLDPILTLLFDCSDKVVALLTPLYISCYKTDNNKKGGGGGLNTDFTYFFRRVIRQDTSALPLFKGSEPLTVLVSQCHALLLFACGCATDSR